MKKVIDRKLYDTENAELIYDWSNGLGRTDFNARESELYRTDNGRYFIYHWGGAATGLAETVGGMNTEGETIEVVDEKQAFDFLNEHGATDKAINLFPNQFEDG